MMQGAWRIYSDLTWHITLLTQTKKRFIVHFNHLLRHFCIFYRCRMGRVHYGPLFQVSPQPRPDSTEIHAIERHFALSSRQPVDGIFDRHA